MVKYFCQMLDLMETSLGGSALIRLNTFLYNGKKLNGKENDSDGLPCLGPHNSNERQNGEKITIKLTKRRILNRREQAHPILF